jgi:hypothetical protein
VARSEETQEQPEQALEIPQERADAMKRVQDFQLLSATAIL